MSSVIESRQWSWYCRYLQQYAGPDFQAFYRTPDSFMAQAVTLFKDDRASTVCPIHLGGADYVVKRHNIRGLWHALKKAPCSSRALRSWRIATVLQAHHIPCVQPIALMEQRWGPFQMRSYFVSHYLEGQDALEIFQYQHPQKLLWESAVQAVVTLIRQLDKAALLHRDLNLSNIRIHEGTAYLLDLDGIQSLPRTPEARYQNQARLLRNWEVPHYVAPEACALFHAGFAAQPLAN